MAYATGKSPAPGPQWQAPSVFWVPEESLEEREERDRKSFEERDSKRKKETEREKSSFEWVPY